MRPFDIDFPYIPELPVSGSPRQIFPILIQIINGVVNALVVKEFSIGKSNDTYRRMGEHNNHRIIQLYYTENPKIAQEIETELIRVFIGHPKCKNKRIGSPGRPTDDSFVYVTVKFEKPFSHF